MNPSTACPTRKELLEVASGVIATQEASELEQHLLECSACCAVMAEAMEADPLLQIVRDAGWPPVAMDADTVHLSQRIAQAVETRLNAAEETFVDHQRPPAALDFSWLEPAAAPDELGRLGNFRVLRLLGRGGMGAVFEAEDLRLRRRVALKVMLPGLSNDSSMTERFLREAQSAAAVHHGHVVTIYEVGQCGTVPYLAMELLRGESLEERLARDGKLQTRPAAAIGAQIAEGLSAAHQLGLLHRDIKPANIWLETTPTSGKDDLPNVKLLDFGLAKSMHATDGMTQTGVLVGTLKYLSPEQARGEPLDGRSDLFSLGCILYRLLTGRLPFDGSDALSQLHALANTEPTSIESLVEHVPAEFTELTRRLLDRNRDQRPASAAEVAERLRNIATKSMSGDAVPPRLPAVRSGGAFGTRPRQWIMAGLVPACLLLVVIIITFRKPDGSEIEVKIDTDPKSSAVVSPVRAIQLRSVPAEPTSANVLSLTHLDPSQIPETERFDWQPKELVAVLGEHRLRHWRRVMQIRFHPDSKYFVTVPDEGPSSLWPIDSLESQVDAMRAGGGATAGFEFSQDGRWMFSANQLYAVDLMDAANPQIKLARTLPTDENRFGSGDVAIHANRWVIMASDTPGMLGVWDIAAEPARVIKTVKFDSAAPTNGLSLSKDGKRLIAWAGDGLIRIWDLDWSNADDPAFTLRNEQVPATHAELSPDGSLMVAYVDGQPKFDVWDVSGTPSVVQQQVDHGGHVFAFSADSRQLFVSAGLGAHAYTLEAGRWVRRHTLTSAMSAIISLAVSPDQKTVVAGDQYGGIHVWDMSVTPPQRRNPLPPVNNVISVTFAPNGRTLLAQGADNAATLWNLDGETPSRTPWSIYCDPGLPPSYSPDSRLARIENDVWNLTTHPPTRIAESVQIMSRFGPAGTSMFILENDKLIRRGWELTQRGRFILTDEQDLWKSPVPVTTNDAALTLQFGSQRFATRQDAHTVCVWSIANATKPLFELKHDLTGVNSIALSTDGQVLLAFSQADSVVWDLEEVPPREYRLQLNAYLRSAYFSPDKKRLFVADGDGIGIYDWASNHEVRRLTFPGHTRQIVAHPDGKHVATVNGNGTVYILRLPETN